MQVVHSLQLVHFARTTSNLSPICSPFVEEPQLYLQLVRFQFLWHLQFFLVVRQPFLHESKMVHTCGVTPVFSYDHHQRYEVLLGAYRIDEEPHVLEWALLKSCLDLVRQIENGHAHLTIRKVMFRMCLLLSQVFKCIQTNFIIHYYLSTKFNIIIYLKFNQLLL